MHLPNESGTSVASAQETPSLQAERCQCCPFGYHIDLDFVNFAQEVASGRKNVDSSRRQTPVTFADAKRAKQQLNGAAHREQTPPSAFRSISKRSLNDIVNDLNELTENAQNHPYSRETPSKDENLGFSTLPSKISAKHVEWSPPISGTLESSHSERYTPNYSRQTPLIDPMNSANWSDFRDTSKTPLTVSANEEVQQILEHQPRSTAVKRLVTSAPTSPVSRTYYTAIGQSLAHLKDRTPVSQISRTDHSYTTTTSSTPRRSFLNSTPSVPLVSNDSPAAKPPLPRRYFDVQRRNRVLSPDPESSTASPNLLRSSNLQSRTYFKPSNNGSNGNTIINGNSSSTQKNVPYRSRFNNGSINNYVGSTGSPLFDSFASVKRSLGLSFLEDNLSPINHVSSPLIYSYTPTPQNLQSTQTQTPPIQITHPKNFRDSPTQTPPPVRKSTNVESQTNKVYLKNASVSTMPSEKRSIGTHILPSQNTVSLDTSDLSEPPAKRTQFSVEFQYCIGHESEHLYEDLLDIIPKRKHSKGTVAVPQTTNAATLCRPLCVNNKTQTDESNLEKTNGETQTSDDWLMAEVRAMMKAEKTERKSADKKTETEEEGEFILITCSRCQDPIDGEQYEKITDEEPTAPERNVISQSSSPHTVTLKSSSSSSDQDEGLGLIEPLDFDLVEHHQDRSQSEELSSPQFKTPSPRQTRKFGEDSKSLKSEKSLDDEEKEMLANLDQLANLDPDRFSLASVQTIICVPQPQEEEELPSRQLDPTKAEAIRKLLTEPQQTSSFQRESSTNRSYRVEKKTLELDYILDKHSSTEKSLPTVSSTPSDDPEKALKEMVVLKKFTSIPSSFPDPIPAKIPRPKFSKFSQVVEQAETPDEADEAVDKLTPLRSELHYLDSWRTGPHYRRAFRHHQYPNFGASSTQEPISYINAQSPTQDDTDEEDEINDPVSTSNSSITSLEEDASSSNDGEALDFEMTAPLKEALETLNKHLLENDTAEHSTDWAYKYVQHAWLQIATRKAASAGAIKKFIDALNALSPKILETVMNFVDQNGNSALHYSVSHENYEVIATLLDTKICKVDETNKAGYSPVMLAALCTLKNETESAIVQRLFERGNVNAKAIYHGQTALMLSVSHGRIETTNLLLMLAADVNIQDIDGSTALMCAAEHGHKDLVKVLLKRTGIDPSLTDCDGQTALSIAVENGHRDIGVMIYGFLNHSRNEQHESNSL